MQGKFSEHIPPNLIVQLHINKIASDQQQKGQASKSYGKTNSHRTDTPDDLPPLIPNKF